MYKMSLILNYLESSWTPRNKLNRLFLLDPSDCSVDVFRDDVASVEQANCHVLAVSWVTLDHLALWREAHLSDLLHVHLL